MVLRKSAGRESTVFDRKKSVYKWAHTVLTHVVQGSAVFGKGPCGVHF